jgi:signal transduction histidine kinase
VRRLHGLVLDALVPVLVAAVIVAGSVLHGGDSARPLPVGLSVVIAGTLWTRHRAPGWTLAISGALVAVLLHVDATAGTIAVIAPAVALYWLAATRGRPQQLLAAAAAVAAVIVADTLHRGRPTVLQTLGHVMLIAIPLLGAEAMRMHRSYLSVLSERLELAEQTREQEAQRRAEQERTRIARELHDIVAHTLTTINVQAAAAAERAEVGDARTALETIEVASHEAIGELRVILGVLRDNRPSAAPRAPAPGIENIGELVQRARDAGIDVTLEICGQPPTRLSDAVSLAGYRIVQESVTNAHRHAPGAPVRVQLTFDDGRLRLCVENGADTPATTNGTTPGVGIVGMHERASAIGGSLHAGPTPNGFRVLAELPYAVAR